MPYIRTSGNALSALLKLDIPDFNRQADVIRYIDKNEDLIPKSKWEELYKSYKSCPIVLFWIAKSPYAPTPIINKIFQTSTERFKKENDKLWEECGTQCLKSKHLSDSNIAEGVECYFYNGIRRQLLNSIQRKAYKTFPAPFPQKVMEKICEKMISMPESERNRLLLYDTNAFCMIKNEEFYKKMAKQADETILTKLASNPHIKESVRNEVYDRGVLVRELMNPTNYMMKDMYLSAVSSYMDFSFNPSLPRSQTTIKRTDDKETRRLKTAYQDAEQFLYRRIEAHELSSSCEVDLIQRFLSMPSIKNTELLNAFLTNTRNPDVLERTMMAKRFVAGKNIACQNPYMPEERLKEAANKIEDGFAKATNACEYLKKKESQINNILSSITAKNSFYNMIMRFININNFNALNDICFSFIMSSHTPEKYLDEVLKKSIQNANIGIDGTKYETNCISLNLFHLFLNKAVRTQATILDVYKSAQFVERTNHLAPVYFSVKLAEVFTEMECDYIITEMKKQMEEYKIPQEIKEGIENKINEFKKDLLQNQYQKNKDYEKLEQNRLNEELFCIIQEMYNMPTTANTFSYFLKNMDAISILASRLQEKQKEEPEMEL